MTDRGVIIPLANSDGGDLQIVREKDGDVTLIFNRWVEIITVGGKRRVRSYTSAKLTKEGAAQASAALVGEEP